MDARLKPHRSLSWLRLFSLLCTAVSAALWAGAPHASAAFRPGPGTVVIRDFPGEADLVRFMFPVAEASSARTRIAEAATRAGLENRGIEADPEHNEPGARAFLLRTTIGDRTSFLGRQISDQILQGLDVFGTGNLIVELHQGAELLRGSHVEPDGSNFVFRRFRVQPGSGFEYRISPWWLARGVGIVLALGLLPWFLMRRWVVATEQRRVSDTEKVHRLRAAVLALGLLIPLVMLPVMLVAGLFSLPEVLLAGISPGLTRVQGVQTALGMGFLFAVWLWAVVPGYRAILPAYRRLRDIQPARGVRERAKKLRVVAALFLPMVAWFTIVTVLRGRSGPVALALEIGFFVLLLFGGPLLVARLLPTRPVEGRRRERLLSLAKRAGVRVADIKILEVRSDKAANALVIGLIGRGRYIIVTDYLVDRFRDDELDAVVGHELGHAKKHHLALKLGAWFATVGAVAGLVAGVGLLLGDVDPLWFVISLPIAFMLSALLVQGALGLILERRADRFGAELVGYEPMVRALERLAEANMVKRRTGLVWNLLTQHPGINRRVKELRSLSKRDGGSKDKEAESRRAS